MIVPIIKNFSEIICLPFKRDFDISNFNLDEKIRQENTYGQTTTKWEEINYSHFVTFFTNQNISFFVSAKYTVNDIWLFTLEMINGEKNYQKYYFGIYQYFSLVRDFYLRRHPKWVNKITISIPNFHIMCDEMDLIKRLNNSKQFVGFMTEHGFEFKGCYEGKCFKQTKTFLNWEKI